MSSFIGFGERVKGYDVAVLNEREARAAAGILFAFAMISFMNAILVGNFDVLKVFVSAFLLDFFIRVLINPSYSPSMILGRIATRQQNVEYTGAPQKRFAWSLGLGLALLMFFVVVVYDYRGWFNLGICLFCLVLLFFEAAFGICIGCKMYNALTKKTAKHCPGGVCELKRKEAIQNIRLVQILVLLVFLLGVGLLISTL